MSKGEYKVHREPLKELDFTILVIEYPKSELEDKLSYLTREKGNISKTHYGDFIIANFIANINQVVSHINGLVLNQPDLTKARDEILTAIYKRNPLIHPDKLTINSNHVISIRVSKRLSKFEKPLTSLKSWDSKNGEDAADTALKSTLNNAKKASADKNKKKPTAEDVKNLPYEETKQWWRRINKYVKIKKFSPPYTDTILRNRYFHNRTSFATFIVSVCVLDFEELFAMLDSMGIPKSVPPPVLIHELYEICKSVNTFLTFDNAQTLAEEDPENIGDLYESPATGKPRTHTAGTSMKDFAARKNARQSFKDVPKEDLLKLADNMKVFVIGQDPAVDKLAEAVQRASVGLKEPAKPIGSFLFAGRTGVGKTLATKVLADELIKGKENMITIDCSEYSADHEYAKLIGAPAGYIGHEQGGMLTNAIAKNPFSVVVFDEVEKASRKVHELLLQILEEGRLTDGKGSTVSFKDAIIVMTSNVGVFEIDGIKKTVGFGDVAKITDDKKDHAINEALKKKFKPEFLNRIDEIVFFKNLKKKDYMRIIDIELYKLNDNLQNNDTEYKEMELKFDKSIRNYIFDKGIDEKYGARPLKRCIEQEISTPLAVRLIGDSEIDSNSLIKVKLNRKKVDFDIQEKIDSPPFYMTPEIENPEEEITAAFNGESS